MKKKFYYAVVSFMRNDMENVKAVCSITSAVDYEEEDAGLFSISGLIKAVEDLHGEICIPETIMVEKVFEISQGDYEAINERNERYGNNGVVYRDGKRIGNKTKRED